MKVKVAIVECTKCQTPAVLRVPLFQFGQRDPEWLYQADCKCRGKDATLAVRGGDDSPDWKPLVSLGALPEHENEPAAPTLGWWCISGEALLDLLRRAQAGEDADLLYAEHYANSQIEAP